MKFRWKMMIVGIVSLCVSQVVDAGPFRLRHRHHNNCYATQYQHSSYNYQSQTPEGYTNYQAQSTSYSVTATQGIMEGDGLAEVNARRARSGLPPYLPDPLLTQAARNCAAYRAARRLFGHVTGGMGDFQFLPQGAYARFGGCAAYEDAMGWMSCGVEDRTARYAGAYWVRGSDGKRYMHLFAR